jgi:hypothetical protein
LNLNPLFFFFFLWVWGLNPGLALSACSAIELCWSLFIHYIQYIYQTTSEIASQSTQNEIQSILKLVCNSWTCQPLRHSHLCSLSSSH